MKVIVNGEPRQLPPGTTVAALVSLLTGAASGVAVAVNGTVVARGAWQSTRLADSDRVEVLSAVQGG